MGRPSFGCQDDLVALAAQGEAKRFLDGAVVVDIGRVDQVDAGIDSLIHQLCRLGRGL